MRQEREKGQDVKGVLMSLLLWEFGAPPCVTLWEIVWKTPQSWLTQEEWEGGIYPPIPTSHWLRAALEKINSQHF